MFDLKCQTLNLILLEPGYEQASNEGKARMDKLGYVKNMMSIIKELNYKGDRIPAIGLFPKYT